MNFTDADRDIIYNLIYANFKGKFGIDDKWIEVFKTILNTSQPQPSDMEDWTKNQIINWMEKNYPDYMLALINKVKDGVDPKDGCRFKTGLMYILLKHYNLNRVLIRDRDVNGYLFLSSLNNDRISVHSTETCINIETLSMQGGLGRSYLYTGLDVEGLYLRYESFPNKEFSEKIISIWNKNRHLINELSRDWFSGTHIHINHREMMIYFYFKLHNYEIDPYFLAYFNEIFQDDRTIQKVEKRVKETAVFYREVLGLKKSSPERGLQIFMRYFDISTTEGLSKYYIQVNKICDFIKSLPKEKGEYSHTHPLTKGWSYWKGEIRFKLEEVEEAYQAFTNYVLGKESEDGEI